MEIAPNGITKKQDQIYWRLEYVYNDRKKWYEVLTEVNKNANEAVKNNLLKIFNANINNFKNLKNIKLKIQKNS